MNILNTILENVNEVFKHNKCSLIFMRLYFKNSYGFGVGAPSIPHAVKAHKNITINISLMILGSLSID